MANNLPPLEPITEVWVGEEDKGKWISVPPTVNTWEAREYAIRAAKSLQHDEIISQLKALGEIRIQKERGR